jgi:endonuclease/exonuclease/phosphatase family metal-dependent hydrolase
VGVQEMVAQKDGHRQLDDIRAMLPSFEYIGRSRSATNPDDEQSGVFYNPEALDAMESGFFWLSPAPLTPGSFGYGNQGNPRMATWIRFRVRRDSAEFTLVNTHFDHRSSEARYRSADQIQGYLIGDPAYANDGVNIDPNLPMVLIGDFNFELRVDEDWMPENYRGETFDPLKALRAPRLFGLIPTQLSQADPGLFPMLGNLSPYNRLVTQGFFLNALDVAERALPEPVGSFSAFGASELRQGIIDWVLVTPDVRVLQTYIESYRPNGNYPSDHLPIVADISIMN